MQKTGQFLLLLLLFAACSKQKDLSVGSPTPVFQVDFTFTDSTYQLVAGLGEYYMFTDYYMDSLQVLNSVGVFKKTSCDSSNCAKSLRFEIRNTTVGSDFSNSAIIANDVYFFQSLGFVGLSDSLQLGAVSILWVASDGKFWRSDWGGQSSDAHFNILDVTSYESNEKKQSTYRLHIQFNGLLFNSLGSSKPVSGSGYIGIAYP
jgi:hypothetical protein